MTRLALGAKWASLGERGLVEAAAVESPSSELSAKAPKPRPHSLKNQRRVICCRRASRRCCSRVNRVMMSFLCDRFVQIQQHARENRVGCQLCRCASFGKIGGHGIRAGCQFTDAYPAFGEVVFLSRQQRKQVSLFPGRGRTCCDTSKSVIDPLCVAGPTVDQNVLSQRLGTFNK